MPCYNGDANYDRGFEHGTRRYSEEMRKQKETIERFEAVLCGIMQLDPTIVDRINWKEVGITKKQHMNWWKQHQKEDADRLALEAKQKAQKAAAAKLRREKAAAAREARVIKLRKELAALEAQVARKPK